MPARTGCCNNCATLWRVSGMEAGAPQILWRRNFFRQRFGAMIGRVLFCSLDSAGNVFHGGCADIEVFDDPLVTQGAVNSLKMYDPDGALLWGWSPYPTGDLVTYPGFRADPPLTAIKATPGGLVAVTYNTGDQNVIYGVHPDPEVQSHLVLLDATGAVLRRITDLNGTFNALGYTTADGQQIGQSPIRWTLVSATDNCLLLQGFDVTAEQGVTSYVVLNVADLSLHYVMLDGRGRSHYSDLPPANYTISFQGALLDPTHTNRLVVQFARFFLGVPAPAVLLSIDMDTPITADPRTYAGQPFGCIYDEVWSATPADLSNAFGFGFVTDGAYLVGSDNGVSTVMVRNLATGAEIGPITPYPGGGSVPNLWVGGGLLGSGTNAASGWIGTLDPAVPSFARDLKFLAVVSSAFRTTDACALPDDSGESAWAGWYSCGATLVPDV